MRVRHLFQAIVEVDRKSRLRNQDRLRALVGEHRSAVRVFSAHDPTELERAVAAAG